MASAGRRPASLLASGEHGRARGRRVPHGEGSGAPPRRQAGDALRLRESRRAPKLPPGDQAPAALPPRRGRGAAPPRPEHRAERQRDPPASHRSAAERAADPARRIVDPRLRRAVYLSPGQDLAAAVELARRAEALGYESVWVTHGLGRDSFLVLAAYGAATARLGLGNGVVPIYPRHPVAMAQAALTLAEMASGRFVLGVGVSHRETMEGMLGLPLTEPLAVMREYVAVLRGGLGAGADFSGRHYRVHWSMGMPERPPAPSIYLAALSVKMCELAGEIGRAS